MLASYFQYFAGPMRLDELLFWTVGFCNREGAGADRKSHPPCAGPIVESFQSTLATRRKPGDNRREIMLNFRRNIRATIGGRPN